MILEKVLLIQDLLTLGTTDILRRMTLCCAGPICELWDIWEHPWHLHTRYQYHPRTWQRKMIPDVTECPLGCKLVPLMPYAIENYTSNSSLGIWLVYFIMQIHVFNFLDKGYSWCFRQWQRAGVMQWISTWCRFSQHRVSCVCDTGSWPDHWPLFLPFFALQWATYYNSHCVSFVLRINTMLLCQTLFTTQRWWKVRFDDTPLRFVANFTVRTHGLGKIFPCPNQNNEGIREF